MEDDEQDDPKKVKINNEAIDDADTIQQNQQTNEHETLDTIVSKKTNNKNKTKINKKEEITGCRPGSKNYNKFIAIQKRANKIINAKAKEKSITNHIDDDTIKTISIRDEKTVTNNIDDDTLLDGFSHVSTFETDYISPEKTDEKMQSKFFLGTYQKILLFLPNPNLPIVYDN